MYNDICERVIAYWEGNREILPEILSLSGDRLEEVIDGISDTYQDLLAELRGLCYG